MQSGKTLGPNRIPVEFYKQTLSILGPHLVGMFNKMREMGELPPDLRHTMIVVIPNEGKPGNRCASYRPISLLNTEVKILAKILVLRLSRVITSLVHKDQTGGIYTQSCSPAKYRKPT